MDHALTVLICMAGIGLVDWGIIVTIRFLFRLSVRVWERIGYGRRDAESPEQPGESVDT
jgi:hypothetical protein